MTYVHDLQSLAHSTFYFQAVYLPLLFPRSPKFNPSVATNTSSRCSQSSSQCTEITVLGSSLGRRLPPTPHDSSSANGTVNAATEYYNVPPPRPPRSMRPPARDPLSSTGDDPNVTSGDIITPTSPAYIELTGEPYLMATQPPPPSLSGEYSHVMGNLSRQQSRTTSVDGYVDMNLNLPANQNSGTQTTLAVRMRAFRHQLSGIFIANRRDARNNDASHVASSAGGVNKKRKFRRKTSQNKANDKRASAKIGSRRFRTLQAKFDDEGDDANEQNEANDNVTPSFSRQLSIMDDVV